MFPLDYVLAAALLTAPPDTVDPPGAADTYAVLCPTMQRVAQNWEILDPREVRYVLTRTEDYQADMDLLRKRNYDLADAPPLHDCVRFPPRAAVIELLSFNRAYGEQLEKRQHVHRAFAAEYQEALRETEELYQVWEAIRDARCEYYYITVRRQALKKVRDTIGTANYYNGTYPPHVPV